MAFMTMSRSRLLCSALAFALALLVAITLHEAAHAVAALVQGRAPVMYGYAVDDDSVTDTEDVVTALAGPVVSLLLGLAALSLPVRPRSPFWALTLLWGGLVAVQNVAGYLITGPFANIGDIGEVLRVTSAPAVVGWIGFLVGWAITAWLGRTAVRRLSAFVVTDEPLAPQLRDLGLFAWLLGAVLSAVLSIGALGPADLSGGEQAFVVLGSLTSGIFLFFVRTFLDQVRPAGHAVALTVPAAGVAALLVVALARLLVLGPGLQL